MESNTIPTMCEVVCELFSVAYPYRDRLNQDISIIHDAITSKLLECSLCEELFSIFLSIKKTRRKRALLSTHYANKA